MNILQKIQNHTDLINLPGEEIPELCKEIREFLVEKVSKTGGHLASNLGAVELTVALHRVYDPMRDRILFDVGHQAYVHKMLTGRMEGFDGLRSLDGLAGFPKPCESNADPFIAGHASDSVSVALGMARARTMLGEDYDVVAVLGDGALSGGLSYEALNDAGESGEPIVVILNDNDMSINRSVGSVAKMLRRARVKPGYRQFKKAYQSAMKELPHLYEAAHKLKEKLKTSLLEPGIFDEMGFHYIGPVDGHDEKELEKVIRWARDLRQPVLLHVHTVKGKGYPPAENNPELYHGVSPFNPRIGVQTKQVDDFSAQFGRSVVRLAESDPTICAVTAAMESGTGLEGFAARFPSRFFEVGIAEEHAASLCAGMAKQGMSPVFAVYSTFLQRSYDMLMTDIGIMQLHVVLAVDRAGLVGRDGVTHHGSFDIAYLSSVPGMQIFAPSSYAELDTMLERAFHEVPGPVAVRYPRGKQGAYHDDHGREDISVLREGDALTIVTHGIMINSALEAADRLLAEGVRAEVIKVNRIRPFAPEKILASLNKTGALLTVEDACRAGNVGGLILMEAAQRNIVLHTVKQLDLGSGIVSHGAPEELYHRLGLDADGVFRSAMEIVNEKSKA